MKPTKFKNVKQYFDVKPWDINRTNINSPQDKYQDKVLENLEKKNKVKKKKVKKPQIPHIPKNAPKKYIDYHEECLTNNKIPLSMIEWNKKISIAEQKRLNSKWKGARQAPSLWEKMDRDPVYESTLIKRGGDTLAYRKALMPLKESEN